MPLPAEACSPDFRDPFAAFKAEGARRPTIGGYGFGFHAQPGTSKSIDGWADPTGEDARSVSTAPPAVWGRGQRRAAKEINPREKGKP